MMNTYLMSLSSIKWEDSVLPITALISIILFAGIFKVAKALSSPFQHPYFKMWKTHARRRWIANRSHCSGF